ncbi:hypothetical protein CC79DRAFT_1372239 [Sarocladium strictum]
MSPQNKNALQTFLVCCLFCAVNKICKEKSGVVYHSGNPGTDRLLDPFQVFLCKLAQILDSRKGGDTTTALVALQGQDGPEYLFTSNNRKDGEFKSAKDFLTGFLKLIGENPDDLNEKAAQKRALWEILEFNFSRVDYYLKGILLSIRKCIDKTNDLDVLQRLQEFEAKADFLRDMSPELKDRCLSDCETLIKAIHFTKVDGFDRTISEHAGSDEDSACWSELRHYFGRLYSNRQAVTYILKAASDWPELFRSFTVQYVPSSRLTRVTLPKPQPALHSIIREALPSIELDEYSHYLRDLQERGLERNMNDKLKARPLRQLVHCEVHLHDFLTNKGIVESASYWRNSMFIATSKPPCRLCHYYFEDPDNDFQVQASHMNVYPRWRLPEFPGDQDEDDTAHDEVFDDISYQMQQDTLQLMKKQVPQGKYHDSRTNTRGVTTVTEPGGDEHSGAEVLSMSSGTSEEGSGG